MTILDFLGPICLAMESEHSMKHFILLQKSVLPFRIQILEQRFHLLCFDSSLSEWRFRLNKDQLFFARRTGKILDNSLNFAELLARKRFKFKGLIFTRALATQCMQRGKLKRNKSSFFRITSVISFISASRFVWWNLDGIRDVYFGGCAVVKSVPVMREIGSDYDVISGAASQLAGSPQGQNRWHTTHEIAACRKVFKKWKKNAVLCL